MPGWSPSPSCTITLPVIRERPVSLGFGALLNCQSQRLSPQWRPGSDCYSCSRDSPGQKLKFPSVTIKAVSWAAQTYCIDSSAWPSSTTAATIAIGWLTTTAAKTDSSARDFEYSASQHQMFTGLLNLLSCRCVTASSRRGLSKMGVSSVAIAQEGAHVRSPDVTRPDS